jgi:hypothetical protein
MARGELHVQLNVDYADDPKLADVSRSARLLYVDMLCKAKRTLNDGIFTLSQIRKLMYPEPPARADKALAELVATGAVTRTGAGYAVTAWLKRNKSRAQIEQDRRDAEAAALLGNHKRWHVARGERDPKCRHCIEGDDPDPGSGTRSGGRSGSVAQPESGGNRVVSPETETETETETKNKNKNQPPVAPRAAETRAPEPEGDPGPAERLVTAWIAGCNRRPPSRVVDDVGRLVAEMLRDGTPAADIERGIRLWQDRGSNPRTLPSYVNQVMNSRPSNVLALPASKPSTTDQRVGQALALAEKFREDPA